MMKINSNKSPNFEIDVSYSQVAVFHEGLSNPFNDWSPQHVQQGFSWREKSVSFNTLDECGKLSIFIALVNNFEQQNLSNRIIRVPFSIPESGEIEIASISDGQALTLPFGDYSLYFETGFENEEDMWSLFSFCRQFDKSPKILKADEKIIIPEEYLMFAEPAKS